MKKIIPLLCLAFTTHAIAEDVIRTELQERYKFQPRKSHWITTFGFETIKYKTEYQFNGVKQNYTPNEAELFGGRLGFGGEMHLGAGFHTATKLEGFYYGSLFNKRKTASSEFPNVTTSSRKDTSSVFGGDISQSLSFMFDMKTKNPFMGEWTYLTVEPFIEAGIGLGRAHNRRRYHTDLQTVNEEYKASVSDEFTTGKLAAGINFISTSGYFLYLKATQYDINITNRTINTYTRQNGQAGVQSPEQKLKKVDTDPVMVYAIGGGYKF
jgi:hypothetical protein